MCHLRASISVMLEFIYENLNLGLLIETGIIIQFVDHSFVYYIVMFDDVLVQVKGLVFSVKDDNSTKSSLILLGRSFLITAKTKIDVYVRTLTMELDGEIVEFNIFSVIRLPGNIYYVICM